MTVSIQFASLIIFLLVFTRFAAMLAFNPLFSFAGVPARIRVGLVLFLTLLIAPMVIPETLPELSGFTFVFAILRELFVGAIYGFIFYLFYYFLVFAGDLIDTDIGLAMAKAFDPGTNMQVGFAGKVLSMLFMLYIIATGSHLALIRIFITSFDSIPLGAYTLGTPVITFILELFVSVFLLALRLMAPFMVAELVLQFAMGVLMRFVQQITIFVINFQLRIMLGLLMLFLFAPYIGQFVDNYLEVLFDNLVDATAVMAG